MLLKSTVFLAAVVAVNSASFQRRNIPVEVRYERLDHDITSNLAEKVQLSSEELKENRLKLEKLSIADEDLLVPTKDHSNLIKNLDEKIQLSPEELLQAPKHIPIHHSLQGTPTEEDDLNKLGERAVPLPENSNDEVANKVSIIEQAQDIIEKGLENIRKNFIPKGNQIAPSKELWDKLENDVKEFLMKERNKLGSRQDPGANQQNIFQSITSGFQQLTNNFVQQFQGQIQNVQNGTSGDEGTQTQQQGPIQGFIGYFTGGVQNVVSTIQNIGQNAQQVAGNSTVLGDAGTGQPQPQPGNFIGTIVTGVQQLFQAPQQGINQVFSGNNTLGDTGTGNPPGQQQGFFAGAINQFNQVVSNIIPTQAPPAGQGDEGAGAAPIQGGNPIQQVFQTVGTAFNQFIQGGPQNKPTGSEDETSSPPPNQNFIQNIGQNIGSALQNIQNNFRPPFIGNLAQNSTGSKKPTTSKPPGASGETTLSERSEDAPTTNPTTTGEPKEVMTATE